jgi:hypothetical protein
MFVDNAAPSPSTVQFVEPDYVLTGPEFDPDAYFGVGTAVRVDRYGRRWVLDYVDAAMVSDEVGDLDAALGAVDPAAASATADTGLAGIEFNDDAGVVHELELTSWDVVECPPDTFPYFSDHVQNGGMTHPVPMAYPNSPVVRLITPGASACTGTVVWGAVGGVGVLTAAHCVTTSDGSPQDPLDFTVCTLENLDINTSPPFVADCYAVMEINPAPNWDGDGDIVDDWAILALDQDPDVYNMLINGAYLDGDVDNYVDHHRGYPVKHRTCVDNVVTADADTANDAFDGRDMYMSSGDVQGTPVGWMKWDTSTCNGCSGGPHFFCPAGNCTTASTYISGVQAAQSLCANPPCLSGYVSGPKARDFRVSALGLIPKPNECPAPTEAEFAQVAPLSPYLVIPAVDISPNSCGPGGPRVGTSTCGDIVVYVPPAGVYKKDGIFVFLPGNDNRPEQHDFILQLAAFAGYPTIGLSYENDNELAAQCAPGDPTKDDCAPTDFTQECNYKVRKEVITGEDDPDTQLPTVPFQVSDSILYRLWNVLDTLEQYDVSGADGIPGDTYRWEESFVHLTDQEGAPLPGGVIHTEVPGGGAWATMMSAVLWPKVAVGGFSLGSGYAALIAMENEVPGLFLLDGPGDVCDDGGTLAPATYYSALTTGDWPSKEANRFGAFHSGEGRPVGWPFLGFGTDQDWDAEVSTKSAQNPPGTPSLATVTTGSVLMEYAIASIVTSQDEGDVPQGDCGDHESLALGLGPVDFTSCFGDDPVCELSCMPKFATDPSALVLGDNSAESAQETHLYEAYVQGLCEMARSMHVPP